MNEQALIPTREQLERGEDAVRRFRERVGPRALYRRPRHVYRIADRRHLELYRDLFSGKHDALKVIVLKDLYELLEKIVDRCRDAGNVISQIALKNS